MDAEVDRMCCIRLRLSCWRPAGDLAHLLDVLREAGLMKLCYFGRHERDGSQRIKPRPNQQFQTDAFFTHSHWTRPLRRASRVHSRAAKQPAVASRSRLSRRFRLAFRVVCRSTLATAPSTLASVAVCSVSTLCLLKASKLKCDLALPP